jgi:hypothetical protein
VAVLYHQPSARDRTFSTALTHAARFQRAPAQIKDLKRRFDPALRSIGRVQQDMEGLSGRCSGSTWAQGVGFDLSVNPGFRV